MLKMNEIKKNLNIHHQHELFMNKNKIFIIIISTNKREEKVWFGFFFYADTRLRYGSKAVGD
jgi:hypothetical protein